MRLRRRLMDIDPNNLKVLVPTEKPIANIGGAEIYCYAGKEEFQEGYDNCINISESFTRI